MEKSDLRKSLWKNSKCIPINRAHQTEQLLWRHHIVIYYGMHGIAVWMGLAMKMTKIFKNSSFVKLSEFEKSFGI